LAARCVLSIFAAFTGRTLDPRRQGFADTPHYFKVLPGPRDYILRYLGRHLSHATHLIAELICPLTHRTFRLRRRPGTTPSSSLFGLSWLGNGLLSWPGSGLYCFIRFVRHLFSSRSIV
jgi:hypothetical protein